MSMTYPYRITPTQASWRSAKRSLALICTLGIVAMAACSPFTGVCTADLQWRLTPREQTMRVGESFTPELALFGCGGRQRLSDTVTWETGTGSVVAVAATGRVTAVAVGQATVTARAQRYGVSDAVQVTVVAP